MLVLAFLQWIEVFAEININAWSGCILVIHENSILEFITTEFRVQIDKCYNNIVAAPSTLKITSTESMNMAATLLFIHIETSTYCVTVKW